MRISAAQIFASIWRRTHRNERGSIFRLYTILYKLPPRAKYKRKNKTFMGLKKYYIDGSAVPDEEVASVENFIKNSAHNIAADIGKKCSYVAFWEGGRKKSCVYGK